MPIGDTDHLSDGALLDMALAGPESEGGRGAASALLARHQDRIYAVCFYYMGDYDRAVDVAQDALINAYRNLRKLRGRTRLGSWLFSIARNQCLSELRRPVRTTSEGYDPQRVVSPEKNPEERLLEQQGEDALLALIREYLTREEAEALLLRCIERMPVDQITRVLDLPGSTGARGVLQTARRKLRAVLDRR